MKFKFDAEQEFQLDAIDAIVDLFEGQPHIEADIKFIKGQSTLGTVNNRLDLTGEEILENLKKVQERRLCGALCKPIDCSIRVTPVYGQTQSLPERPVLRLGLIADFKTSINELLAPNLGGLYAFLALHQSLRR